MERRSGTTGRPRVWAVAAITAIALAVLVALAFAGPAHGATRVAGFEAETMRLPSGTGQVFDDPEAGGGKALLIWSDAAASREVSSPASDRIVVRVKGDQCNGSPQMTVKVDGRQVMQGWVWQTDWTDYTAEVDLDDGSHTVEIAFGHDYSASDCDRNLRIDKVSFLGATAPEPAPEPSGDLFAGAELYVDPNSNAVRQAEHWRNEGRYADAEEIEEIATGSQARWFVDWNGDVQAEADRFVTTANNVGALPTLVAYNIPIRDCGSYSSGGAGSAAEYRAWIDSFAAGIGSKRAAVILEPDALSLMHCLSSAQKQERYDLLSYAIQRLEKTNTDVYVDAGHSNWHSSSEMANRLANAGISNATGFALNVSNYEYTANNVGYGKAISSQIDGKHFVVDTSRNGNGPGDTWCNPPGRALGQMPTDATSDPLADAYLWIKPPGESDGTCNGGPPAGQWWPSYALGLAQRAAY